jgi:Protein of unknown function (DUF3300)
MIQCRIVLAASVLAGFILLSVGSPARAQFADAAADTATAAGDAAGGEQGSTLLTAEELNALVAPVALYPDELLAVVLPASTNPLQIVEAQRFLDQKKSNPDTKPNEEWDPSVLALLNYPQVIKQMNDDLSWTQDLGNAVMDQQADVLNAIQAARDSASDAGYLQSNEQQTVTVSDNDKIVIESAQPEVIYVPQYDPAPIVNNTYVEYPPPVYSEPYPPYWAPGAAFFTGAVVGAAFAYGFDWDDNDIDIDCCDGGGDVDIDNNVNVERGDINIGSGNTNIDKTKLQNRVNGDRKANGDGKMKWSSQKARQKSSLPRKDQAANRANRPKSADIQKQLKQQPGAGKAAQAKQNRVKSNNATKAQSQRGQQSLKQTKKPQQQLRQNSANKQQMKRQQQPQQQKQLQNRQLKQKQGGSFQNSNRSQNQVRQQSNRGNKSLNRGGNSKPPRPNRR